MKVTTLLVCTVTTYLLAASRSAMAQQLQCETNINSSQLTSLLQESPTEDCRNQMLAIIAVQDVIAELALVLQGLVIICEPVCLEYVRMFGVECLPSYIPALGLACGRNQQTAQFCYQTVVQNNGTFLLEECFPQGYLPNFPATTTVSTTFPPFMCSPACRNVVVDFRAIHGCCVTNAFNTSIFGLQAFPIADYSLWSACGVETVSTTCPSPFVVDGPSTTVAVTGPATGSGYVLVAHGMISLLALLMALEFIV